MATPGPRNADYTHQPSIIIDPSLYEPERRWLLQTICETFIRTTRVLTTVVLSGTALAAVTLSVQPRPEQARHSSIIMAAAGGLPSAAEELLSRARSSLWAVGARAEQASAGAGTDERAPASIELVDLRQLLLQQADVCGAALPGASAAHSLEPLAEQPVAATPKPAFDLASGVRTGRRLLATNRLEEAAAAYRRVLAVREREPAALLGLARVQLARGQLDEALALAQRAVEATPDRPGGHLTLGDVLRAQGARAPAAAQYELATRLELKPEAPVEQGPLSAL